MLSTTKISQNRVFIKIKNSVCIVNIYDAAASTPLALDKIYGRVASPLQLESRCDIRKALCVVLIAV